MDRMSLASEAEQKLADIVDGRMAAHDREAVQALIPAMEIVHAEWAQGLNERLRANGFGQLATDG